MAGKDKKKSGATPKERVRASERKPPVAREKPPAAQAPPAGAVEVRTFHHVIVCSYPWLAEGASFGSGPEHGSQHGSAGRENGKWITLAQNTPAYGRQVVAWLSARNVDIVTGFWSGDAARPCIEHFDASLGSLPAQELGTLRLADMYALAAPLADLERAVAERAPRMRDPRYARLVDAAGAARAPIFLRGALGDRRPAAFRETIDRLRALFAARFTGVNPFFVGSHHLLSPFDGDVVRSLDAVFHDGCAQTFDEAGHPALMTTAQAVNPTRAAWAADLAVLDGTTALASGLPVYYIAGSAPSVIPRDDVRRGAVIAEHKDQIALMFAALRDDARTLRQARAGDGGAEIHKWVAVTSAADWGAQSAIEPCVVRPHRSFREVTAWGYDYGTDAIDLLGDLFRPETALVAAAALEHGPADQAGPPGNRRAS